MSTRAIYIWTTIISIGMFITSYYLVVKYNVFEKAALEEVASATLGVKVTIGEYHVNEEQGTARLGHVKVFNPHRYLEGAALEIEKVDVWIDSRQSNTIKFKEIVLSGIQVNLEVQKDRYNLNSIMQKLKSRRPSPDLEDLGKMKVTIDSVAFRDNKIRPRAVLYTKAADTVEIPDIQLTAIGYAENGLPVQEAIAAVWGQVGTEFERQTELAGFLQGYVQGPEGDDGEQDYGHASHSAYKSDGEGKSTDASQHKTESKGKNSKPHDSEPDTMEEKHLIGE